jgi:hypothetical protein
VWIGSERRKGGRREERGEKKENGEWRMENGRRDEGAGGEGAVVKISNEFPERKSVALDSVENSLYISCFASFGVSSPAFKNFIQVQHLRGGREGGGRRRRGEEEGRGRREGERGGRRGWREVVKIYRRAVSSG